MTAIWGLWHRARRAGAAQASQAMARALAIYGRDRTGLWDGDEIALGIGLARLLPEDAYDRQPLSGGGGRFRLLADVRLDNRPELADSLLIPPAAARTMADADFVLAAWEKWQEAALGHLLGDFAIAIWDDARRCLHLARDFAGRRPLFYHQGRDFFAFATMAKGLHALPDVPRAPDLGALTEYLVLAPQRGSGSFFAGISRVEPGGLVTLHADGRVTRRDWYGYGSIQPLRLPSDADYVDALRATFDRAVADRLRATGRVATQLSGGLDSTAVTATAAGLLSAKGRGLAAYTHVPLPGAETELARDRIKDEWPHASRLASAYPNIDHVRVEARGREMGADLDSFFHYFEHPALNICNLVWLYEIAHLAGRDGHKVLLSGGMGNMTISLDGLERLPELLAAGHLRTWFREALALNRSGHTLVGAFFKCSVAPFLPGRLYRGLRTLRGRGNWKLAEYSALRRDIADSPAFRARMKALDYDPHFQLSRSIPETVRFVLQRFDHKGLEQKGYLAAFGIDTRDPTADRRLVELVLSMPSSMFLRAGQEKWIYHQVFADRVPEAIRRETRKGYQAADWPERFRRAQPALKAQMERAATRPAVAGLMEAEDILSAITEGLPEGVPNFRAMMKYRLRTLRGLSVAHFIAKLDPSNA